MLEIKKTGKSYAWWLYPILAVCLAGQILPSADAQEELSYREIAQFQMDWDVSSFSWNANSTQLALGMCGVEEVRILDISSGDYEVITTQRRCAELDWDKVGGLLAIVDNSWQCNDNQILIWQAETQEIIQTLETTGCIQSIQWNTDGTQLLGYLRWQGRWSIQVWDIETEQSEAILERSSVEEQIEVFALSPDGAMLAVASNPLRGQDRLPSVNIIDIASGEITQQLTDEGTPRLGLRDLLSWSPQGDMLAARLTDLGSRGGVVFWDIGSGEIVSRSDASAVAWHPTENYIAVNVVPDDAGQGEYKNIFVREIDGDILARLEGHEAEVMLLAWNPDGTQLASSGTDRTIRIWGR